MTTKLGSLESEALVRVTRFQTVFQDSKHHIEHIRSEFNEQRCVQLPEFLEPRLLREVQYRIDKAEFYDRKDKGIGLESCMKKNSVFDFLHFLLNDEKLFHAIQVITGCNRIRCFMGRLYRMIPGSGHYDSWHNDMDGRRMIGLSINLSTKIFEGGVFELRDMRNGRIVQKIANTGFGDAILFRLAYHLKHRVNNVRGSIPRVAFAGWFQSQPGFLSLLRK